jgi:hypothetical protein
MHRFGFALGFCAAVLFAVAVPASAGVDPCPDPPCVDEGYLDTFELNDGRDLDVGALGGGLDSDPVGGPNTTKIVVQPQPIGTGPWPPDTLPSDGRLTGTVHGKFRVVFFGDVDGSGFINGADLDDTFDVSWQLVGFDKDLGPDSAFFVTDDPVGPEGAVRPYGPPDSVNFPPTAGGTGSVWNIAACDATGFNPGTGTEFCNPFAIPGPGPFTGYVDYTFPVSIPGSNDFTPGLTIGDINWILAALVGRRSEANGGAGGDIAYGFDPLFDPEIVVNESVADLFGPATLLNFPGEDANVDKATLLTTIQIEVKPEPATLSLLLGGLALLRRRRS